MIVFIATILVSAIAAGVLISTSQKLQAKSTQTGNEATTNVVGTLDVIQVFGVRSGTTGADLIDQLDITVQTSAGADPIDMSTLVFLINDGTTEVTVDTCVPGGTVTAPTEYAMTVVRGNALDCGFMESGDLVYLHLGLAGAMPVELIAGGIPENSQVDLQIVPTYGFPVLSKFVVPPLGADRQVILI